MLLMVIEIINFILGPTCTSIQNQQHNENVRSLQNYHLPSINYSQIPLAVSFHGKKENFFFFLLLSDMRRNWYLAHKVREALSEFCHLRKQDEDLVY